MILALASAALAGPMDFIADDGDLDSDEPFLVDVPLEIVPPGTDNRGIVNGTNAGINDFPETVALYSSWYGGQFCSGTLIHPEWVLTAGHCIEEPIYSLVVQGRVDVHFGTNANSPLSIYNADAGYIHPQYTNTQYSITYDVALLHLSSPVNNGVEEAVLNDEGPTGDWVGEDLTFVGFGATTDSGAGSGTKRYADVEVDGYDIHVVASFDRDDSDGHQNVCYGDSGGSAFENEPSGPELAGVNSFVYAERSGDDPCDEGGNGAARVDQHIEWIEDYVPVLRLSPDDPPSKTGGTTNEPDPPDDIIDTGIDLDALDLDHDEWAAPVRPVKGIYGACATGPTPASLVPVLVLLALFRRR